MIFAYLYSSGDPLNFFVIVLLTLVAVVVSLVLHELAHGYVALWNGDYTAKHAGRLTFNPVKHFDPIGFLMMMLVGFGYAKPVPVNPYNFKHFRKGLVTVSIAGVTVNTILAFLSSLFSALMQLAYTASFEAGNEALYIFCWYVMIFFTIMTSINLMLLFFNILPIFPLDGFRVVEALSHQGNKYCAFMRTNGQYILYGLVGLSFIVSTAINYVSTLPGWFGYLDILGTYLDFCSSGVSWLFGAFWRLMIPVGYFVPFPIWLL